MHADDDVDVEDVLVERIAAVKDLLACSNVQIKTISAVDLGRRRNTRIGRIIKMID